MKIAQVCPYDIDRPGGVQMHIRDTAAAFMELGHEVTILAPKMGNSTPDEAVWEGAGRLNVVKLGVAQKVSLGATGYEISIARGAERDALDAFMSRGFDVVHYHTMWTPLLPYQAFRRSRAANVATFHDTTAKTATGFVLKTLFRAIGKRLLPRLDAVIAVSQAPMEHLQAARGVKVHIVPPCTDLRRFVANRDGMQRFADGRVNILFLGRLEKRKGAEILLHAYKRLIDDGLNVRLLIAGSGSEEDTLRRFVAQNALTEVVFIGAFSQFESPQLYADCDIFCAPSPYGESFGIVVAEAMASGKPVVAAANAGYRTLLKGEAARFLSEPGDPNALYERLKTLVLDPDLRRRLGEWGRQEALTYDCRAVAPKLISIYEEAIAKSRSRKRFAA